MSEWIESEFKSTDLGDARLDARLRTILTRMWQSPLASISSACRGFAEVMAASRFFDNEAVTQNAILEPQRAAIGAQAGANREADIYEIFVESQRRCERGEPAARWLIRSQHDRCLEAFEQERRPRISQRIAQSPLLGTVTFGMPAREQNPKIKGVRTKTLRSGREVTMELRTMQVTLLAPFRSKVQGGKLPPVQITVIQALEIAPPAGEAAILWTLLTSLDVTTLEQARDVLKLYGGRWEIEVFHKVLKSGCRIEEIQLCKGERMKRAILLFMIVAWRVMYVMKLGRECPDLPCDVVFEEDEWQSVCVVLEGVHEAPGLSRFAWQEGYRAFPVSQSQRVSVRHYIGEPRGAPS